MGGEGQSRRRWRRGFIAAGGSGRLDLERSVKGASQPRARSQCDGNNGAGALSRQWQRVPCQGPVATAPDQRPAAAFGHGCALIVAGFRRRMGHRVIPLAQTGDSLERGFVVGELFISGREKFAGAAVPPAGDAEGEGHGDERIPIPAVEALDSCAMRRAMKRPSSRSPSARTIPKSSPPTRAAKSRPRTERVIAEAARR